MTSADSLLRLRPEHVEWRLVDGEVVALDLERSLYLGINPSGAAIWPELAEGAERRGQLIARLVREFGIAESQAAADLTPFLDELVERGLVEDGPPA